MRILHIVLSRGFAGSERSTAESCNAQCAEHTVSLIVRSDHRNRDGASILDHLDPRVRVIQVPKWFLTGWKVRAAIRALAPEVIHCHLRRSVRIVARMRPQAATVATLHIGVNGPHFQHMGGIICNARWQLAEIPAQYTGLVLKANNSLTPHRRLSADEVAALRQELDVAPGDFLVGGVGRMTEVKGWDTLIQAVRQLPQLDRLKVVLFGNGSALEQFKTLAGPDPRIRFMGFRPNVKDFYQAFDAFVCPSRFEPLPRVMLEAMDAGTPVMASDADGCRELIEDYGGGMFPAGDASALAQLLLKQVQAGPVRTAIDLSAHHIAQTNATMLDFYRRVAAHGREVASS